MLTRKPLPDSAGLPTPEITHLQSMKFYFDSAMVGSVSPQPGNAAADRSDDNIPDVQADLPSRTVAVVTMEESNDTLSFTRKHKKRSKRTDKYKGFL
jgi:hypothetical protein